jgi:HIRAN domain
MTSQGQFVTCGIVGARYRPPAAGLLGILPSGAALEVRREPENPYDPNALQVLVHCNALATLSEEQLQAAVEGFGFSAAEVALHEPPEWHLGYVPRSEASELAGNFDVAGVREVAASLTFDLQGRPCVAFVVP